MSIFCLIRAVTLFPSVNLQTESIHKSRQGWWKLHWTRQSMQNSNDMSDYFQHTANKTFIMSSIFIFKFLIPKHWLTHLFLSIVSFSPCDKRLIDTQRSIRADAVLNQNANSYQTWVSATHENEDGCIDRDNVTHRLHNGGKMRARSALQWDRSNIVSDGTNGWIKEIQ